MKILWNRINKLNMGNESKNKMFLAIMVMIYSLIGSLVWMMVGRIFLPNIEWLICFAGYPAVCIGFIGGTAFLYQNEFA